MAVILRIGLYGTYYGNEKNSSNPLNKTQMEHNATYIKNYLTNQGWTLNAICGILGNMQSESSINPGRWQSDDVGNTSGGYGLVQWTPATKYQNWVNPLEDYSTMDNNLSRILYELTNNIQWIKTPQYNYSFQEFTQSEDTPYNLGMAFVTNYERPESISTQRGLNAVSWWKFFGGTTITTKKKRFKWVLYSRKLRVNRM